MLKYERFTPQSPSSEILWKDEMWVTPHLSWPTGRSWLAPQMVLGFSICSMNVGFSFNECRPPSPPGFSFCNLSVEEFSRLNRFISSTRHFSNTP